MDGCPKLNLGVRVKGRGVVLGIYWCVVVIWQWVVDGEGGVRGGIVCRTLMSL